MQEHIGKKLKFLQVPYICFLKVAIVEIVCINMVHCSMAEGTGAKHKQGAFMVKIGAKQRKG